MTRHLPSTHPYWLVRELAAKAQDSIRRLHLSHYVYVPQTISDNRCLVELEIADFIQPKFVEEVINSIPTDRELAFHSLVSLTDGSEAHIPLIDMSTGSAAQLEKLRPYLGADLYGLFEWYRSGRSFHGYAAALVSPKQWAAMLGVLLLANQKGLAPTVDPRWIGHRLIAGYSALRWTKNTRYYIELPKSITQGRSTTLN